MRPFLWKEMGRSLNKLYIWNQQTMGNPMVVFFSPFYWFFEICPFFFLRFHYDRFSEFSNIFWGKALKVGPKIRKSIIKSVKKFLKGNGDIGQEIFLCWTCRIHQILHQIFILYLFWPPVFQLIKYSRGSVGPNFDPNWSKLK